MRIAWSSLAKKRVTEYGDYIAEDNPDAAGKWVTEIIEAVERLKEFPEQGRVVPEAPRADVREIFHMSHRIVYRIEPRRIIILTVRHSRQLMEAKDLK